VGPFARQQGSPRSLARLRDSIEREACGRPNEVSPKRLRRAPRQARRKLIRDWPDAIDGALLGLGTVRRGSVPEGLAVRGGPGEDPRSL
jgi:hypothetical protein